MAGMRNAIVLPVPVLARAITSPPSSTCRKGRVGLWMGGNVGAPTNQGSTAAAHMPAGTGTASWRNQNQQKIEQEQHNRGQQQVEQCFAA